AGAGPRRNCRIVAAKQCSGGMTAGRGQDRPCRKYSRTLAPTPFYRTREVDDPRIPGAEIANAGDAVAEELLQNLVDGRIGLRVGGTSRQRENDVDMTVNQTRKQGQPAEVLSFDTFRDRQPRSRPNAANATVLDDDNRVGHRGCAGAIDHRRADQRQWRNGLRSELIGMCCYQYEEKHT